MTLRIILYVLAAAVCTLLIWLWNRGSQRRRFARAYRTEQPWPAGDAPFLRLVETAYGLRRGTAIRIPPASTPMDLYLTLYPEHCIYDAGENERLIRLLRVSRDALTQSFGTLAAQFAASGSSAAQPGQHGDKPAEGQHDHQ